jgi:hypothetical protein
MKFSERMGQHYERADMLTLRAILSSSAIRLLFRLFAGLLIIYFAFGAFIWWSMRQPPEKFGRIMARIPGPVVFLLFPFETLWTHARAGGLSVGDPAPDFSLLTQDKSGSIQLSTLNKQRPVVLVFGSYT